MNAITVLVLLAAISLVYATVGQAGGTGFLAVMAFMGMPADELRPSALILNVVASGYTTWRLNNDRIIDWRFLATVAVPALPASFLGGLIALESTTYYALTGGILLFAAAMMVVRVHATVTGSPGPAPAVLMGAVAGFASGLTGVGGGVFLAPAIIALGWVTAKHAAGLSAPFIFGNSITGLAGTLIAGQHPSIDIGLYALAALFGAIAGTLIGQRFTGERATRYILAAILVVAAVRLLTR